MDKRFILYRLPEGGFEYLPPGGTAARADTAEQALAESAETELVLLIPGEHVLLTDVTLPPVRQPGKRLMAARFALEDFLVTPVDSQHFALGASDGRGKNPVAVIDRALLEIYLDELGPARQRVVSIVPDTLCLPLADRDAWTVWLAGERALVRSGIASGFATDTANLPTCLRALPADEQNPLIVYADDAAAQADLLETLHGDGQDFETHAQPAALLQCWSGRPLLNLASGEFAGGPRKVAWWAPLKATAALLAVWVGIALATQIIEYNRLQSQLAALDSEAEQIFRETFPRVETINDLRFQAEEEIRRLRGEAGSGGLFPLLQATAAGTGDSGRLTMQSLQYREGRLSLNLLGEDLKALEALRSNFNRQPATSLAVENVDADNDAVRIRATVTEAGA